MNWLARIHEWATRVQVARVDDPVLGELVVNESWWECEVDSETGPIVLCVGGRYEPDPALVEAARCTFLRIDEFVEDVSTFLTNNANQSGDELFAAEVRSLRIESVSYFWAKQPQSGMIYFKGTDECKCWHCDINGGTFHSLVFDT